MTLTVETALNQVILELSADARRVLVEALQRIG